MSRGARPPVGLRVIPIDDVVQLVPDLVPLGSQEQRAFDVFICSLGFEDRCVAVAEAMAETGCTSAHAIVLRYETNTDDNRRLELPLRAHLEAMHSDVTELDVDAPGFAHALAQALSAMSSLQHRPVQVGWDVSVASSQAVMRVLYELLRLDCELEVLYAEAAQYYPLRDEYEADREAWTDEERLNLERGVLNVEFSSEYPGEHDAQLPHVIAMFPGFSRDRVRRIIAKIDNEFTIDFEHAPVIWLLGLPPRVENQWRQDAVRQVQGVPPDHEQREVSTFDPRETMIALERLYAEHGLDRNVTLSPMGSKMQALGAGLFCYAHPDVRVAFARPSEYNAERYSSGVGGLWSLDLGETAQLRFALRRVGTIELLYDEPHSRR